MDAKLNNRFGNNRFGIMHTKPDINELHINFGEIYMVIPIDNELIQLETDMAIINVKVQNEMDIFDNFDFTWEYFLQIDNMEIISIYLKDKYFEKNNHFDKICIQLHRKFGQNVEINGM